MNYIMKEVFTNCGHVKSEQLVRCATNPQDTRVAYHTNLITAPAMCTACLRQVEADLDQEVDDIIRDIIESIQKRERQIDELDDGIGPHDEEEGEWDQIDKLNDEINELVRGVDEVKARGNERMKQWRESQGYFADG